MPIQFELRQKHSSQVKLISTKQNQSIALNILSQPVELITVIKNEEQSRMLLPEPYRINCVNVYFYTLCKHAALLPYSFFRNKTHRASAINFPSILNNSIYQNFINFSSPTPGNEKREKSSLYSGSRKTRGSCQNTARGNEHIANGFLTHNQRMHFKIVPSQIVNTLFEFGQKVRC